LIDRVSCICGTVSYCSQICQEKDNIHQENCLEIKKRDNDPAFINFIVPEKPSNGIMGLQNIGNTCYMNSAL